MADTGEWVNFSAQKSRKLHFSRAAQLRDGVAGTSLGREDLQELGIFAGGSRGSRDEPELTEHAGELRRTLYFRKTLSMIVCPGKGS